MSPPIEARARAQKRALVAGETAQKRLRHPMLRAEEPGGPRGEPAQRMRPSSGAPSRPAAGPSRKAGCARRGKASSEGRTMSVLGSPRRFLGAERLLLARSRSSKTRARSASCSPRTSSAAAPAPGLTVSQPRSKTTIRRNARTMTLCLADCRQKASAHASTRRSGTGWLTGGGGSCRKSSGKSASNAGNQATVANTIPSMPKLAKNPRLLSP